MDTEQVWTDAKAGWVKYAKDKCSIDVDCTDVNAMARWVWIHVMCKAFDDGYEYGTHTVGAKYLQPSIVWSWYYNKVRNEGIEGVTLAMCTWIMMHGAYDRRIQSEVMRQLPDDWFTPDEQTEIYNEFIGTDEDDILEFCKRRGYCD